MSSRVLIVLAIAAACCGLGYALVSHRGRGQGVPNPYAARAPRPKPASPPPPAPARASGQRNSIDALPPPSLELEIRSMQAVQRALRANHGTRALKLLAELDREVPEGRLVEERRGALVMARCELGDAAGSQLAREFARDYPESTYFARVKETCRSALHKPSNHGR